MKHFFKPIILTLSILMMILSFSCSRNQTLATIREEKLFTVNYGKYENELHLFNLANLGYINTKLYMKDGFFFIADDNAKKVMQMTSYGDLIGIIYNPETNPKPSFLRKLEISQANSTTSSELESPKTTTQTAKEHLFNKISNIAVDSNKNIFVIDQISDERQEQDIHSKTILKEVVLRFTNDGKFIDYIGQEGPGGTPFPFIKDIFVTKNNELIVTCVTNDGHTVYWFNQSGFLKYTIPIKTESIPMVKKDELENAEIFVTIDKIIPDYTKQKLFIKTDYHKTLIDTEANVQSGIEYFQTLLHPLNVENGQFEEALVIPPYEDIVTDAFSKLTYKTAFDFLGVTESGWFFFMIPDNTGYVIQMIQPNGQRIIKRHLDYNKDKTVYLNFSLSDEGIISAILSTNENTQVLWWRTDSLIESIL